MTQRAFFLSLGVAVLSLGSALSPVAAYVDRDEWGAGLVRQPLTAALDLRAPELPPPKPASPRLRFAHAKVVRSFPENGAVVPETVGKVEVWYDNPIAKAFVALAVINAAGDRVDKRDAAIDSADWTHVSVSVEPLTPGEYTVRYRAVSADTHLVSGAWVFEVRHQ
jgi:methionine-rich copper-binding protein CopC